MKGMNGVQGVKRAKGVKDMKGLNGMKYSSIWLDPSKYIHPDSTLQLIGLWCGYAILVKPGFTHFFFSNL